MDFESIKARFWDEQLPGEVLAPLTDEMVRRAESTLGVQLPEAYLALLRVRNGGNTSALFQAYPCTEAKGWAPDHVPFESMNGIGEADEGILENDYFLNEWDMPKGLILLTGDGHWWIGLDYRHRGAGGPPSVVWYDNELNEDVQLAPDFGTFVAGLRSVEEFEAA